MTWSYHSDSGRFYDPQGNYIVTGYSGTGVGRNNPNLEPIHNEGPIPRGKYTIGPSHTEDVLGQVVMNLTPGFDAYGRTDFRIHGDNEQHDASHGCIILPRWARQAVAASGDHDLVVL